MLLILCIQWDAVIGDNFGVQILTDNPLIWVLLDDRAGNRSQALGVAMALGQPVQQKELRYGPAAKLPNLVLGASISGLTKQSKNDLKAPWPALVISAGRRTAPVARWIKAQSSGKTQLVQIMDPGSGRDDFDLICMPAHDQPQASLNTMVINGGAAWPDIVEVGFCSNRLGRQIKRRKITQGSR